MTHQNPQQNQPPFFIQLTLSLLSVKTHSEKCLQNGNSFTKPRRTVILPHQKPRVRNCSGGHATMLVAGTPCVQITGQLIHPHRDTLHLMQTSSHLMHLLSDITLTAKEIFLSSRRIFFLIF